MSHTEIRHIIWKRQERNEKTKNTPLINCSRLLVSFELKLSKQQDLYLLPQPPTRLNYQEIMSKINYVIIF